jgi:hypothetical protein
LAATVTIPASINGPVVNGVTLVLVVVAALLLTYHLSTFNAVTTVLFDATVTDGSLLHRLIVYHNCSCEYRNLLGFTFNLLMDWLRIMV